MLDEGTTHDRHRPPRRLMTAPTPSEMSQRELDEYLDRLTADGREDTPEFAAAYEEWERRG